MNKICAFLLCSLIFALNFLKAQDSTETPQNLKSLLQNVAQNPLLQAKITEKESLEEEKGALYGEYLPKVALGYSYNLLQNPDIFYPKRLEGWFLEAQWTLFDGFKREGKFQMVKNKIQAKEYEQQDTKEQLQLKIIQEYFNALSLQSRLNALNNQQKELQESIAKYQKFYDAGLAALDALEAIKSQSYQNSYAIESANVALKAHLEQISLLSGIETKTLSERSKLEEISTERRGQPRGDLQSHLYALKAQENLKSQYTYLPTILLNNRYTRYNYYERNIPILPFAIPINEPDYQNIFGLTIQLTLFDTLATLRARESARLSALASHFEYNYHKDAQERELIIAKESLLSAKDKIQWATSSLKSASIAYSYAKEKFNAQLIDYTQYLNALTTLLNAQSFYDASRFEYEIKKAEFLYKNGESLENFIKD